MKKFVLAFALAVFSTAVGFAQFTGFQYASLPGSWVGQGTSYSSYGVIGPYTPTNTGPLIINASSYGNGLSLSMSYFGNNWSMLITPPSGSALTVGTFEAQRMNIVSGYGSLDFFGNGRGYNWSFGTVEIQEISYTSSGSLDRLALGFSQRGGSYMDVPDTHIATEWGQVRYNSTIPFSAIPEPSTYALIAGGVMLIGVIAWKRRKTSAVARKPQAA